MTYLTKEQLGFVLAIDGCGRGCGHCPAFGLKKSPTMAPIADLRARLRRIRVAFPGVDFANNFRTIHAWRISDLADYRYTAGGTVYDVVSVADAWYDLLGQPLYVVTNGTIGNTARQESLQQLAANPDLVSQIKLTVTPFDPKFHRGRYIDNMAHDVATLWPLSSLPGRRKEGKQGHRRFSISVKATAAQGDEVQDVLRRILKTAELKPAEITQLMSGTDPRLKIKPVYDLRVTDNQPVPEGAIQLGGSPASRLKAGTVRDQHQLGFRPNGKAFTVDLWAFRETDRGDYFGHWF